jgi:hypothetical protein
MGATLEVIFATIFAGSVGLLDETAEEPVMVRITNRFH